MRGLNPTVTAKFLRWFRSQELSKQASLYFLAVILGVLLAVGGYNLSKLLGPATVKVEAIPFGLAPQTAIKVGKPSALPEPLERLSPSTLQELKRAEDLCTAGAWAQASEVYEAMVLQNPKLAAALYGAANALLHLDSLRPERMTSVEGYIAALAKAAPKNVHLVVIKSLYAERTGKNIEAIELAREARELSPAFAEGRLRLGLLLLASGQPTQADGEIRAGISLTAGGDPRYFAALAQVLHQRGELDSCSGVIEYALSKFPSQSDLLILQGYLLEYAGKFEQAEQCYQRVLALRPENRSAQIALATLGEKSPPGEQSGKGQRLSPRDRAQVAIDILEPLVAAYPENLPLREALGQAYLKGRLFDMARLQFTEIQEQDPEYPDIQLRLQEAAAVHQNAAAEQMLASNLQRSVDSLRVKDEPRSPETLLGHYLVRYGASAKEFFSRYSVARFTRLDSNTWQESFVDAPLMHQYTVFFDKQGYYGVHVLVRDTSYKPGMRGRVYDLFGQLLKVNGRISGIGTATGQSDCGGTIFDGAVWEARDNFEFLAKLDNRPNELRMIRLDPRKRPEDSRLCSYLPYLKRF
jgi:tetratricopeptide (TPR) repeat protein